MLASALRRNIGDRAFQDLQQRLLHAFAGNIPGNRRILVLASDLVDLVDVDDACLRASHIAVSGLQQLQDNVFDVLAYVAGFRQRGRVHDGEGNVEHLGQRMRKQCLAAARGAHEQDVRLRQLHIVPARPIHLDALVMVVDCNRQLLLRLLLADNVLIEESLYLERLGQVGRRRPRRRLAAVILQNGIADRDAFVADVSAGVVAGR